MDESGRKSGKQRFEPQKLLTLLLRDVVPRDVGVRDDSAPGGFGQRRDGHSEPPLFRRRMPRIIKYEMIARTVQYRMDSVQRFARAFTGFLRGPAANLQVVDSRIDAHER